MSYFIPLEPDSTLEDTYYFHMLRLEPRQRLSLARPSSSSHADADTSGSQPGVPLRQAPFVVQPGGGLWAGGSGPGGSGPGLGLRGGGAGDRAVGDGPWVMSCGPGAMGAVSSRCPGGPRSA